MTTEARLPVIPRPAHLLGVFGLTPFVAGCAAIWLTGADRPTWLTTAFVGYGAVIIAFMGAIHWGLAMALERAPGRIYLHSIWPALAGWCAILLPPLAGIALLIAAFAAVYALDRRTVSAAFAPSWYLRLRLPLTLAVTALLAAGGAAMLHWR